jgi:hypothetical protein
VSERMGSAGGMLTERLRRERTSVFFNDHQWVRGEGGGWAYIAR